MLRSTACQLLFAGALVDTASAKAHTNPIGQVLTLLDNLASKIAKDGEAEAKAYAEYVEWCDDTSKNAGFAIQTAETSKAQLEAKIGELVANIAIAGSRIEELAASIATDQAELKDATAIRQKEASDFKASEAELAETIETLGRAISILSREMAKNPASLAQVDSRNLASTVKALSAVLDAAAFPSEDAAKLAAFVQAQANEASDDMELAAPAAATYKSHSGNIVDVLADLKEKAESQLSDLRKAEVNSNHNFEMLRQSLEDQVSADTKDLSAAKAGKEASEESKATAEGDLSMTIKDLASSTGQLETTHSTCLTVASDHTATVEARKGELAAIAQAKKVLDETASGATSQTYSFIQQQALESRAELAGAEVVAKIKQLARQQHSGALAQLASRIASVLRLGTSSKGPFAKVKGLIEDMITRLEAQAGAEATEKSYCDEQMANTEAKQAELEADIAKMTSKIDQAAARSARLNSDIQNLEAELAALAREQAEMDSIRQESHAEYTTAKSDLELGLSGVRQALKTLQDYYGAGSAAMLQDDSKFGAFMQQPAAPEMHSKSTGAGESIIGLLQVVESDFATNLVKEESAEEGAQSLYEKTTQENQVIRTTKEQAVKYKTQEAKSQDKTAAEYSADRDTTNSQLSAVLEYYGKIKDRCIARPEAYATRAARRQAEIQGLKEALSILEDETALVQRKRSSFRGVLAAL